jgi:hypothetical protein
MERSYESGCESDLEKDDVDVLAKRYNKFIDAIDYIKSKENGIKKKRLRAQWTTMHDAVQEHFTSHVMLNGSVHLLPPNIYALKQSSKQSWMLYKKRECERRKRLRQKIEKEKKVEESGGPANLLLSMVDACEVCRKLYITVNLFWGVTLCDVCYFNEDVINEIMKTKKNTLISSSSSSAIKVIDRKHPSVKDTTESSSSSYDWKAKYFTLPPSPPPPPQQPISRASPTLSSSDEEVIVEEDSCQFDEEVEDMRPISLYHKPPTPPGSPFFSSNSQYELEVKQICEEITSIPVDFDY